MATEGVILNNYYVSPMCTPTRASIMSGKHPIHLGRFEYNTARKLPYLIFKINKKSYSRLQVDEPQTKRKVMKAEARLKINLATLSHVISRALRQLPVIISSFDWFTVLSVPFVIG